MSNGDRCEQNEQSGEPMKGGDDVIAPDAGKVGDAGESARCLQVAMDLNKEGDVFLRERRYDEALACFTEVLERFGAATDGEFGRQVRTAFSRRGGTLLLLDRFDEARVAFEEFCKRTAQAASPAEALVQAQEQIARTVSLRARDLFGVGQYDHMIDLANMLLAGWGEISLPGVAERVIEVSRLEAAALVAGGRSADAISVLGAVVKRYCAAEEPGTQLGIAAALEEQAALLLDNGRNEETVEVADALLVRLERSNDYRHNVLAAKGLSHRALALARLGNLKEAIRVDEEAEERFTDAGETELSEIMVRIMGHKAHCLRELGEFERAISTWGELVECYEDRSAPVVRNLVAHAMQQGVDLMAMTGRGSEVIALADLLVARLDEEEDQLALSKVLVSKAATLIDLGRDEEGIAILDGLTVRFRDSSDPQLRRDMAAALRAKAVALDHLGRSEEAALVFENMADHFGKEALLIFDEHGRNAEALGPKARPELAVALWSKGWVLASLGRKADAVSVLTEVISRFSGESDMGIQQTVEDARAMRANLLDIGS